MVTPEEIIHMLNDPHVYQKQVDLEICDEQHADIVENGNYLDSDKFLDSATKNLIFLDKNRRFLSRNIKFLLTLHREE